MSARLAALKARLDEAKAKDAGGLTPKPRTSTDISPTTPKPVVGAGSSTSSTTASSSTSGTSLSNRYPTSSRLSESKAGPSSNLTPIQLQSRLDPIVGVLMKALEVPGSKGEYVEILQRGVDPAFRVTALRNTSVRSKLKGKIPAKNHELLESRLAKLQATNAALSDSTMFLISSIFEDKSLAEFMTSPPLPPPSTPYPSSTPSTTSSASTSTTTSAEPSPAKALLMQRAAARVSLSAPLKSPPPPPKSGSVSDSTSVSIQQPDFDSASLSISSRLAALSTSGPGSLSRLSSSGTSSSTTSSTSTLRSSISTSSISPSSSPRSSASFPGSNSTTTTSTATKPTPLSSLTSNRSTLSGSSSGSLTPRGSASSLNPVPRLSTNTSVTSVSSSTSPISTTGSTSTISSARASLNYAASLRIDSATPRGSSSSTTSPTSSITNASSLSGGLGVSPALPTAANSTSPLRRLSASAGADVSASTQSSIATTTTTETKVSQRSTQTQASTVFERMKKMTGFSQENQGPIFHCSPADLNLLDLRYGDQIVLRANSGLFAGVGANGIFSSAHPASFPLTLVNPKDTFDKGPVRFQHTVLLSCGANQNLNVEANGTIKLKQDASGEKWTLVSVIDANLKSEGPVKIYERVAFRSSMGPFLTCNENDTCSLGGLSITPNQIFSLSRADLPLIADWDRKRYFELHEQMTFSKPDVKAVESFNALSPVEREAMLLEDLLHVLMTIEGKYIVVSNVEHNIPSYDVHKEIHDETLTTTLRRILPVCTHFAVLRNYIHTCSRFEYGVVHHALCAALKEIEHQYSLVVVQLEKQFTLGSLTLLRAWYYLQPIIHLVENMAKLVKRAINVKGGGLCNLIYEDRLKQGDETIRSVYDRLLERAVAPYFSILANWIYQGEIEDSFHEFQIHQRKDLHKDNVSKDFNDSYWEQRFSTREENLPGFLESVAKKIFLTGKYLNVVRECGRTINSPFRVEDLRFSFNPKEYEDAIEAAYIFSCRELLNIVLKEEQLSARLSSIKRYFFLFQGDFFTHFMDIAGKELETTVVTTETPKLASLLDLALRTSNAVSDQFFENVGCTVQKFSLMEKLDALRRVEPAPSDKPKPALKKWEGFTLTYNVRFPLTLVISRKSLTKYQMISRLLFSCKHVERALERAWISHQGTKELVLRAVLHASHALRYRMLSFWQNLLYYFMTEVLEPNFCELRSQLETVITVDQVLYFHNAFLDKCLKECLLTSHDLISVLFKLLDYCLKFAQNTDNFFNDNVSKKLVSVGEEGEADKKVETTAQRRVRLKVTSDHVRNIAGSSAYSSMVSTFVTRFDAKLVEFINLLRKKSSSAFDNHLGNLLTRLNFNDYFENPGVSER